MNLANHCEIERPIIGTSVPTQGNLQETELNMMQLRDQLFKATNEKERSRIKWEIVKQACMYNLPDEDKPKFRELEGRYS